MPSVPRRVIIKCMTYCKRCEIDRDFCEHGLGERCRAATLTVGELPIYANGVAHFQGCLREGGDSHYRRWAKYPPLTRTLS